MCAQLHNIIALTIMHSITLEDKHIHGYIFLIEMLDPYLINSNTVCIIYAF